MDIPENIAMSKFIEITNKLQDVCAEMGNDLHYELPQIAVVGSQSSGKSSVLEGIVGSDFLPRGTGIVTRRPLVLQLINGPETYGVFSHCKDKKFREFDAIRMEIQAATDHVAGAGKNISDNPINLRIYSPKVLNLTLVDLPGLTKVAMDDQPKDIEKQVKKMILKFIRKENCLILAVTPANIDLANSDALKLAREVDEHGLRTIGVITKLDLMDEGTNALDILENKIFPLQRGYVGVVNRSQADIERKEDIDAALEAEYDFFENHPDYGHIADRMGTKHLQLVLNQQLGEHIRKHLPNFRDKLQKRYVMLNEEITTLKQLHPTDDFKMLKTLHSIINQLRKDFDKEIGTLGAESIETDRLTCGTEINILFYERFPKDISEITCNEDELRVAINYGVRNLYGVRSYTFIPHMMFETIVKDEITRLEKPIRICVEAVLELLSVAIRTCILRIIHYPKIRNEIENMIMSHVHTNGPTYKRNVLALINMERAHQNTNHEDFKIKKEAEISVAEITNGVEAIKNVVGVVKNAAEAVENWPKTDSSQNGSSDGSEARTLNDQIIQEGFLGIENFDGDDSFWFVLNPNILSCFDDKDKSDGKFILPLNGLNVRIIEQGPDSEKHILALYKSNGQNVYQRYKQIELSSKSVDYINTWEKSFLRAFSKNHRETRQEKEELDPKLNNDVDVIYERVDLNLKIVRKTQCDMIPKAIKLYIIDELQNYIETELPSILIDSHGNLEENFAMDSKQAEQLGKKEKMLLACQNALEIIHI